MKIEGEAPNHQALVQKLNVVGPSHHLNFALADLDFDYRIVLITTQSSAKSTRGEAKQDVASATVYDAEGKQLFQFEQDGTWADPGGAGTAAIQNRPEFREIRNRRRQVAFEQLL